MKTKSVIIGSPLIIISISAIFLFYKHVLQIYPSVISEQLMREYHLNGVGMGALAATFYYSYLVTQLFVGILLDRYSLRWLNTIAIVCCAVGILLFAGTNEVYTTFFSRTLMGAGVAFATVSYFKLASIWFSPQNYAFISGLLASAAMAGAVFGEAPLAVMNKYLGWRESLGVLGIVGFILAFMALRFIQDKEPLTHQKKLVSTLLKDSLSIFRSKKNWLLTVYSGLAYSPIAIFGGLWGVPFLQVAYKLNKTQSASMISLIFIGLGIGSPILGKLSDRFNARYSIMFWCTLLAGIILTMIIYCNNVNCIVLGILLFSFGFSLGAYLIAFVIGKEINNPLLIASVVAMINSSDSFLNGITEPLIGRLLDVGWDGKISQGVHIFSVFAYQVALTILPVYLFVGSALILTLRYLAPSLKRVKDKLFLE